MILIALLLFGPAVLVAVVLASFPADRKFVIAAAITLVALGIAFVIIQENPSAGRFGMLSGWPGPATALSALMVVPVAIAQGLRRKFALGAPSYVGTVLLATIGMVAIPAILFFLV